METSVSTLSTDPDWSHLNDLPRPFDVICDDLAALGALSLQDFLSGSTSTAIDFDVSFHPQSISSLPEKGTSAGEATEESQRAGNVAPTKYHRPSIPLLNQTSQRIFGSTDPIKFEFLEEDPKNKQCILSITRPNGATRSYKSGPGFSRRADAKAQAAKLAVEMGAIEFIASGDVNVMKKKGHLLNPIDVDIDSMELDDIATAAMQKFAEEERPVKQIEQCCEEWRLGQVKPHWISFDDAKDKKQHGSALRIALNAHVFRAYAVDPIYNSTKEAKIACAKVALEEGVIDFIQFGNGQTQLPSKVEQDEQDEMTNEKKETTPLLKPLTLQEFYDSLPQPFPEYVGEMTASAINAPVWLNTTMQSARGGQLHSSFIPIVDSARHLHGCILRVERPGETKTYLMDARFPKRSDAKSAVCLLAMSQGVGDYIRKLKEAAENKLPAEKRKLANEKLLQIIAANCSKVRNGNRPIFEFTSGRDAFGCTLKADISPLASEPNIREYKVPVEYCTKADAKAAVACLAAEQGLIDLLRFKGAAPPPDYIPFWEAQVNGTGDNYVGKRKEPERDLDGEGRDRKKRRKGNKDSGFEPGEVLDVKVKQDFDHPLPSKPATISSPMAGPSSPNPKIIKKKPHTTGPSSLGPTNAFASATRMVGQDRLGNRSGGLDHHHSYPVYPSSQSPSFPSYIHPPNVVYGPGPAFQSGPAPMFTSSDPYQDPYVSYPPLIQGHHPNPYQPAALHPPYTYFAVPSSPHPPMVAPTHMAYAPYPYPHQYPQPYPHGHYPVNYGPHPPVMYQTGPAVVPTSAYPPVAPAVLPPYSTFTPPPPPPLESTRSPPRPSHYRPSDEITNNKDPSPSTSDSRTNGSYNRHSSNKSHNGKEHPSTSDNQQSNHGSSQSVHHLSYLTSIFYI
ncbi:hypothetical protein BYT27DRAFT_6705741 [Phlegmacium glaucopus]|nr:hypothetical protein BYT27DRAFT_6705741 [Phlegmacium glaucopus]